MSDVRTAIALASARKKMKLEMIEAYSNQLRYYKRIHELISSGRPDQALSYTEILITMAEGYIQDLQPKPKRKRDYARIKRTL